MGEKVRVGVVGAGFIANGAHLPSYAALDTVELVAICDVIPERAQKAADKFGAAKVFTDYQEMLATCDLDVVSVCTPNDGHAPITIAALEAGCNVLCEKPMARNLAEARTMRKVAETAKGQLMIAYPRPFNPSVEYVRSLVEEGYFGNIYHAKAVATRRRGVPTWGKYLNKTIQGGGPLLDIGSHSLHMTLWLAQKFDAVEVSATVHNLIGKTGGYNPSGPWDPAEYQVEDSAFGFIRFADGSSVTLDSSWALHTHGELGGSILYGDKGGAEVYTVGRPEKPIAIYGEDQHRLLDIVPAPVQDSGKSHHYREIDFFVNKVVLGGEAPRVKTDEALKVSEILAAFYESAESGKAVRLD